MIWICLKFGDASPPVMHFCREDDDDALYRWMEWDGKADGPRVQWSMHCTSLFLGDFVNTSFKERESNRHN